MWSGWCVSVSRMEIPTSVIAVCLLALAQGENRYRLEQGNKYSKTKQQKGRGKERRERMTG